MTVISRSYVSPASKTLRSFKVYLNVRPRPMLSMWIMTVLRSSHRAERIVVFTAHTHAQPPLLADAPRHNFSSYFSPSIPSPAKAERQDLGDLNLTDADSVVTRAPPTCPQRTGAQIARGSHRRRIRRGELIFDSRVDKTFT